MSPDTQKKRYLIIGCFSIVVILCTIFLLPKLFASHYVYGTDEGVVSKKIPAVATSVATSTDSVKAPTPQYVSTPDSVKAIYMSQCVVGTPSFRNKLVDLVDTTELNSIIIDIKDFSGTIGFPTKNPLLASASMKICGAPDMRQFIETLHAKGIYVIGRITVFQDPYYTKAYPEQAVQSKSTGSPWKDRKGLSFIDVSSKAYWDVVVELSKESHEIGFDELNYDYIRYPSDGNMADTVYVNPNKQVALEEFFKYLHDKVSPIGVVTSADLFGMTTVAQDDLGIGQILERALPYFDYIAPMVYPSHFSKGFNNLGDPNKHVYEVIAHSMGEAVKRTVATSSRFAVLGSELIASTSPKLYTKVSYPKTKLRPWLQDFNYGGTYGPAEVRAQIKATYDVGLTSWMLWAPSNVYTKEALDN